MPDDTAALAEREGGTRGHLGIVSIREVDKNRLSSEGLPKGDRVRTGLKGDAQVAFLKCDAVGAYLGNSLPRVADHDVRSVGHSCKRRRRGSATLGFRQQR